MRKFTWVLVSLLACGASKAIDQITIDQVAGKTGELHLKLTERSPLSSLAEMAKRMGAKPDPSAADYDLSKQDFYVYVPSSPGDDGKYGLMDVQPFLEGHGFAPKALVPILEKYHLIWIAPEHGGTEQPSPQRIGEVIDAVYNARKAWPISDRRVYAMITMWKRPDTGVALYYSDQFTGILEVTQLSWWTPIRTSDGVYPPQLQRPSDESLAGAKKLRFFDVMRDSVEPKMQKLDEAIFRDGYQRLMRYTKRIVVPDAGANIWSNFSAD